MSVSPFSSSGQQLVDRGVHEGRRHHEADRARLLELLHESASDDAPVGALLDQGLDGLRPSGRRRRTCARPA